MPKDASKEVTRSPDVFDDWQHRQHFNFELEYRPSNSMTDFARLCPVMGYWRGPIFYIIHANKYQKISFMMDTSQREVMRTAITPFICPKVGAMGTFKKWPDPNSICSHVGTYA